MKSIKFYKVEYVEYVSNIKWRYEGGEIGMFQLCIMPPDAIKPAWKKPCTKLILYRFHQKTCNTG